MQLSQLTAAGGRLFFSADDGAHGQELWASDGAEGGTRLVRDIWPGTGSSDPAELMSLDGRLFFSAADSAHGRELWASDGTEGGTRLVQDINPGIAGSIPSSLSATANGQLFFSAWSPGRGGELWVSDGDGTRMAQEIAPGGQSASPNSLIAASAQLFLSANDGASGPALWALPLESQPFRRTRVAARTTVQAEDFDRGGEGLAYHDADAFSHRGLYRPAEAVDLDATASGGYQLGWAQPGEWLNYSLDIAATRAYTLELSLASLGPGGTLHIELDGADLSGPIRVPDTGGWDRWQTVVGPPLQLPAGRHTLRLVLDSAGASGYIGNIDWLSLDGSSARAYMPEVQR
jgi:ELWxxDGT repeat protein